MDKLLYGVAYYDEYMPYDRLEQDIQMMLEAGINVVRIAESTWSTLEPQNGIFNFYHIDRVMDAMYQAGIHVIIGTPTYAVPTWMVKEHPDVLAVTIQGKNGYGPRQNMDITNPTYLFYAERVIRKLVEHVKDHPAVIGYQVDNETKHYHTAGENVQTLFVKYMKENFQSLDEINKMFGLDYWSNRINAWEDFPSVNATINGSLKGEFEKFRRQLVTKFLKWQRDIIKEYSLENQFITQNFDFDWHGYSNGIQPDVDHYNASKAMDIVGVDIYHPSQSNLSGVEIAMCGDIARSLKNDNYLVLETEAQGFPSWVPYPGQLRLQAYSHIASGANMVAYWHWHSIHNSLETYWKGLLSHDFLPNPTYNEAKVIGREFREYSDLLVNLKKKSKVAFIISNYALTAIKEFQKYGQEVDYNEQVNLYYKVLYQLNVSCDFIYIDSLTDKEFKEAIEAYELLIVPSLYTAKDEVLHGLNKYIEDGGHVVYSLRSGFCDEYVKVRSVQQPGVINEVCGIHYNQFIDGNEIMLDVSGISQETLELKDKMCKGWIELINSSTAEVLATYDHPVWRQYSAITKNTYGKGTATYFGCVPSEKVLTEVMKKLLYSLHLWDNKINPNFPIVLREGINQNKDIVRFFFNYSMENQRVQYGYNHGRDMMTDEEIRENNQMILEPWGIKIIIEKK